MNQLQLVDKLYDAAVEPAALDQFVAGLAQLTDSAVGGICNIEDAADSRFVSSYGASPHELTEAMAASQFQSEFRRHLPSPPESGTIAYTEDTFPGKRLQSAGFYQSFLQPKGLEQANFLFIEQDSSRLFSANFMRERNRGNYEREQKAVFSSMMPHLRRAYRLKKYTYDELLHQSQAWEMLQLIPYGVIVFSNCGKVLYVNEAAEKITREKDGLCLNSSRLSAQLGAENSRLQLMLSTTIKSVSDPRACMSGGDMLISRPSGKRSYSVMINPISACASVSWVYPAAIVILQDHELGIEAPVERMRALYDLTPAEARVANQVVMGKSLDECAQSLGHTVATSRNLLKRVFAKTDTRRQNDLVSLVLRSPLNLLRRSA